MWSKRLKETFAIVTIGDKFLADITFVQIVLRVATVI